MRDACRINDIYTVGLLLWYSVHNMKKLSDILLFVIPGRTLSRWILVYGKCTGNLHLVQYLLSKRLEGLLHPRAVLLGMSSHSGYQIWRDISSALLAIFHNTWPQICIAKYRKSRRCGPTVLIMLAWVRIERSHTPERASKRSVDRVWRPSDMEVE